MSEPPPIPTTGPISEGNEKVNIITALGDLSEVSTKISSTINHLREFVEETLDNTTERRIILKQVGLITKATKYMTEKVHYVTTQAQVTHITQRVQSRKRAAENRILLSESKTSKARCNYISIEDNVLSKLIRKPKAKISPSKSKRNPNELFKTSTKLMMRNNIPKLKPANGSHFTLREAFVIMKEEGITSHNFFLQATDPKVHRNKIKLHCHRSTFIRRYKKFTKDGILPKVDDYGSNVGAPQIVIKKDVPLLNNSVHKSV